MAFSLRVPKHLFSHLLLGAGGVGRYLEKEKNVSMIMSTPPVLGWCVQTHRLLAPQATMPAAEWRLGPLRPPGNEARRGIGTIVVARGKSFFACRAGLAYPLRRSLRSSFA